MVHQKELENLLKQGAKEFSVELDEEQVNQLFKYKEILIEWNQKMNLTAIEEDQDILIKHFIDSLSIVPYLKKGPAKLIDVGTGAGFPGMVLKVVQRDLDVTLLDSLDKRVKFLNVLIEQLGLQKITAVHGRAEDFGINPSYREKYDHCVARAVANLPVLSEYCLPFTKVGGKFIAMKGSNVEEISQSKKALDTLGGEMEEVREITLPYSDYNRNIIVVRKLRHTPTKYPRKAGKPAKDPL